MAKRRASGEGNIRKRENGRWEGRIIVGHKENGDPIFRYLYADTQKELTAKLRRDIQSYQGVDLTEQSKMTLAEWLDRWLEQMEPLLRSSTSRGYRSDLDNHVKPYLGQKRLDKLAPDDLRRLYDALLDHGRIRSRPGQAPGLSPATVHSIHTTLHHALKTAVEEGLLPSNPADQVVPPKIEKHPKSILTNSQLDTFMAAIQTDEVWHDFFYTEMTTGLRRGEICALRWEDFDGETGTLHVRRTAHREKGTTSTGQTKTYAGTRKFVLPPSTARLLEKRQKTALTAWIFPDPLTPEEPANPASAYRKLKQILADAGLPNIRFHDLRHTFATHAIQSGVDAKTLAGILGHTKASFTLDTYAHVTGDMQRQAAQIVGVLVTDILGEEVIPWQSKNVEMAVSA